MKSGFLMKTSCCELILQVVQIVVVVVFFWGFFFFFLIMALTSKPNVTELCICTKISSSVALKKFPGRLLMAAIVAHLKQTAKGCFFYFFIQDLNCIVRQHSHTIGVYMLFL